MSIQALLSEFRHSQKRSISAKFSFLSSFALQFLVLSLVPAPETLAQSHCKTSIEDKIDTIIGQSHLARTRWGIDIQQISPKGKVAQSLYSRNAQQLFLPASTAKLFSTIALVETFEPTYQIETPYFSTGNAPHLTQLRVLGQGDPSILAPQLTKLAQTLKEQGIQSIDTVVGDGQAFGRPNIIPSWEWEDLQTSDGVPISSLSYSQNSLPLKLSPSSVGQPLKLEWLDGKPLSPLVIENLSTTVKTNQSEYIRLERNLSGTTLTIRGQLRVGAKPDISYVAIAHPTQYFLSRLKESLQNEGIRVKHLKVNYSSKQPPKASEKKLGVILSPPLHEMLKTVNQSSNNFYTESLLRHLAWKSLSSQTATPQHSLKQVKETLSPLGISSNSYFLKDGAGLSRQNLVSPKSLTSVFKVAMAWQSDNNATKFQTFKESLAIAGQTGTLKHRLKESSVAGKLFGKTGTLNDTVTLAGFLQDSEHTTWILSLMANHSDQPTSVLRKAVDEIILKIAQTQACQTKEAK